MLSLLAIYVSGLRSNSFNAIKVFKTKVTRSQRNGKDNTMAYWMCLTISQSILIDRI
jgi:hypothetical protein